MSTIETTPKLAVSNEDVNNAPASGQADKVTPAVLPQSEIEGFDLWIKDFQKYESILNLMSKVSQDPKFKEEVGTIEEWFKILNEPERNAAIYTLIQHLSQDQIRFFAAYLQQMVKPDAPKPAPVAVAAPVAQEPKPKLGKLSFRPPSLDLPPDHLDSPVTPTPVTARESATDNQSHANILAQALHNNAQSGSLAQTNWANMVNTPLVPMFQKDKEAKEKAAAAAASSSAASLPGFPGINPYTLNMLANAGLSAEAQVLAAQLVMSGLVQPTGLGQPGSAKLKKAPVPNWRTPTSARYPGSALRSSGLRPSSGLKSAGLKSSGLAPQTPLSAAVDSPREEDFSPEMLQDIPGWLRTLRLHKYTQCFDGLTWEEMVVLDDATLEAKGIAALGARRRLLRTFEHVRKTMGMEEPSSATPTTTSIPTGAAFKAASEAAGELRVPHSALPRSKLSINSPIFTPTWEAGKLPTSAAPNTTDAAPAPEPEAAAPAPVAEATAA